MGFLTPQNSSKIDVSPAVGGDSQYQNHLVLEVKYFKFKG